MIKIAIRMSGLILIFFTMYLYSIFYITGTNLLYLALLESLLIMSLLVIGVYIILLTIK